MKKYFSKQAQKGKSSKNSFKAQSGFTGGKCQMKRKIIQGK
jgi:hypothetical protein